MLIDAFVCERTGAVQTFDRDGDLAAHGRSDNDVLTALLADPYFALPPPKSTGRERFGAQFLHTHESLLAPLRLEDGVATLTELTAATIADAIVTTGLAAARVLVSGGGAHNRTLLARLCARLPAARVEPSTAMGVPVDAKEAIAFAVLGYETLRGRAANVPRVTGAARAVPLGAIAPCDLAPLLGKLEDECRSS